jgi:nicotinamidase-related amidase
MLIEGSPGCEIAPDLFEQEVRLDSRNLLAGRVQRITEKEVIIYKPRWGAFYQTPLENHLFELGISTLVFTGCNFPNCPRTSIYEAGERDYRIGLVTDAVSGLYDRAEQEMKGIGVNLFTTESLLTVLTGETSEKAS